MKKKIITTALLLCCFFAGIAGIANLNDKWTGVLKTDQGDEYPLLYDFKLDGSQLSGTAKTPKGDVEINDGIITGDRFTFNVVIAGMEFEHSGKFYGDSVGVDISLGKIKSHATLKRTNH
jgi:hypothetical protein